MYGSIQPLQLFLLCIYLGTKNVAKAMQKILRGKGNENIKAKLRDKGKCTCN